MSDAKLRITWKPIGHSTRVAITLEYGDVLFSDTLDVASQRQRERIVDEIVERFDGVNREEVARELERTAKARLTEEPTESKCKPDREPTREKLLAEHDTKVEELLEATDGEILAEAEALLRDPRLMDRVSNAIEALGVVGERKLGQTTYLLATSRLLDKPLSGLVQGASSSGKSFTITKVAELIPPESVFGITNHSPKSFYYMPNGSLMHRFIHAGEMPRGKDGDAIEARKALREMQSAGELSQAVPEKDASNRIVTRVVHQFGPIAYVESTTRADVFNEDLNRVIPLATDESPEQSRRVNLERGRRKARAGGRADLDHLLTVHRTAQRMLYRVSVVIPFA
ncbi:MAG: hypothetical protein ACYTGG_04475, partial [Planctomycetota bacterium]